MSLWRQRSTRIAALAIACLGLHLVLRFGLRAGPLAANIPLFVVLLAGGGPLVVHLAAQAWRREFGSDLLAGISIVTAVLVGEYLAGSIIVLMLSGGQMLEDYAMGRASSALNALARRMPSVAHRVDADAVTDVPVDALRVGDIVEIHPHEVCPADGVVLAGHGAMDESYLTGEPFEITKTQGSAVISGARNGEARLTIRVTAVAADSRYAKIMAIMREAEQRRPQLRRLGDQLASVYTPVALAIAVAAWVVSDDPARFLAVVVIATPCPLLIGIPVAIIGAVSLAARRAIIIKSPVVLEQITGCRTAIFDKTGTLTYGEPSLVEQHTPDGVDGPAVLALVASAERYSKHPLARAIVDAANKGGLRLQDASEVREAPGQGLRAVVAGRHIHLTSRAAFLDEYDREALLPGAGTGGLECVVTVDGQYAGVLKFRDAPRAESRGFVGHLKPAHHFARVMIVSGDRRSEVAFLAERVGITEVHAEQTPEQKLALVRAETARGRTLYVGDGINDAPAMKAATVGVALGQNTDVTTEAADVVILESALHKVDEVLHIGRRMRSVALQSAVGGMVLSVAGMLAAGAGLLSPVEAAIGQEVIDVLAVVNALRAGIPASRMQDFDARGREA